MQNIQKKHYGGLKNVRIRDFNKKYKSIVYKHFKASDLKYNTEITLNIDSEDIEDYVEKKEKEENILKNVHYYTKK